MPDARNCDLTDLTQDELMKMVGIFLGDLFVHYGMWFTEAVHHQGIEKALELENQVLRNYAPIAMRRLASHFGIEMDGDIPKAIKTKSREELLLVLKDIAKTWVASDGLWFQAFERSSTLKDAKHVNDACWAHFASMEAYKIQQFLQLGTDGGLSALEKALKLRVYISINSYASTWQEDGSLLFEMTECRVQSARRRKGLPDYPCKSAGVVEYTHFAKSIDPRIQIECTYCPPDQLSDGKFCGWRFTLE